MKVRQENKYKTVNLMLLMRELTTILKHVNDN